mmetsp:Transcript_38466/g.46414  ORF Transcript_38466/g.46414 Transcript_38466/m.46414 type:complete len:228 (-) Transcript_38466:410-1093(-)
MSKIKLTYFNIEAAAEKIRLAMVLTKTPFEDNRVDFKDWGAMKPTTPFGQLPLMEIDGGDPITQSFAMLRYIGLTKKTSDGGSLYPVDNPSKILEIEEMIGLCDDMQKSWQPALYIGMRHTTYGYPEDWNPDEKSAKVKEMRDKWIGTELPRFAGYFSDRLNKSGAFLCGDKITLADCVLLPQLRYYTKGVADHVPGNCLEPYTAITEYMKRVQEVPEIKEWYASQA